MGQITRTNYGMTKQVVLTNAQIINLPLVDVEIVPPHPTNKRVYIPHTAFLQFHWVADYTGINAAAGLLVQKGDLIILTRLSELSDQTEGKVSGLLAAGEDRFCTLGPRGSVALTFSAPGVLDEAQLRGYATGDTGDDVDSISIRFDNQGDGVLGGGDPGNKLTVTVFYVALPRLSVAQMASVQEFAEAIAYAEGFYTPGSRASRNNNPGDLTVDVAGGSAAVGTDGPFVVYASAADGFADLRSLIEMMISGASSFYNPDMTLLEVGQQYAPGDGLTWAQNVAGRLGVPSSSRLGDVVKVGGVALGIWAVLLLALFLFRKKGGV